MKPRKLTLSNGLQVVLCKTTHAPVVSMQAWVKVGSADESDNIAGISHFLEHMLFKGTKKRGVGEIAKEIEACGGDINAYTSFDQTVYKIDIASRYIDRGLDVLSDLICHSTFDGVELEREKMVVLEEIKRAHDNPGHISSHVLFDTCYKKHPYRRPVLGFSQTVKHITPKKIVDFYSNFYKAKNMVVVVSGDFPNNILKRIENYFNLSKKSFLIPKRKPEPIQNSLRIGIKHLPINEAYLTLAYPICDSKNFDTALLDLLSVIIGQGDSSRLFHELRIKENIANSLLTHPFSPIDKGILITSINLNTSNLAKCFKVTFKVFRDIKNNISEDELKRAKIAIEKDFIYQGETVQGLSRKLGYFAINFKDLNYDKKYLAHVRSAKIKDLLKVASKYLDNKKLNVSMVVPNEAKLTERKIKEILKNAGKY